MSKRKLIADTTLCQDGSWFKSGDPFEASESDAADLIAMKMAHAPNLVEAVEQRIKRRYRTRDMTAQ